jgi:hypothetical protein
VGRQEKQLQPKRWLKILQFLQGRWDLLYVRPCTSTTATTNTTTNTTTKSVQWENVQLPGNLHYGWELEL